MVSVLVSNFNAGLDAGIKASRYKTLRDNQRAVESANSLLAAANSFNPMDPSSSFNIPDTKQSGLGKIFGKHGTFAADRSGGTFSGNSWAALKDKYLRNLSNISDPTTAATLRAQFSSMEKNRMIGLLDNAISAAKSGNQAAASGYLSAVGFYQNAGIRSYVQPGPQGAFIVQNKGPDGKTVGGYAAKVSDIIDMRGRLTDFIGWEKLTFQDKRMRAAAAAKLANDNRNYLLRERQVNQNISASKSAVGINERTSAQNLRQSAITFSRGVSAEIAARDAAEKKLLGAQGLAVSAESVKRQSDFMTLADKLATPTGDSAGVDALSLAKPTAATRGGLTRTTKSGQNVLDPNLGAFRSFIAKSISRGDNQDVGVNLAANIINAVTLNPDTNVVIEENKGVYTMWLNGSLPVNLTKGDAIILAKMVKQLHEDRNGGPTPPPVTGPLPVSAKDLLTTDAAKNSAALKSALGGYIAKPGPGTKTELAAQVAKLPPREQALFMENLTKAIGAQSSAGLDPSQNNGNTSATGLPSQPAGPVVAPGRIGGDHRIPGGTTGLNGGALPGDTPNPMDPVAPLGLGWLMSRHAATPSIGADPRGGGLAPTPPPASPVSPILPVGLGGPVVDQPGLAAPGMPQTPPGGPQPGALTVPPTQAANPSDPAAQDVPAALIAQIAAQGVNMPDALRRQLAYTVGYPTPQNIAILNQAASSMLGPGGARVVESYLMGYLRSQR